MTSCTGLSSPSIIFYLTWIWVCVCVYTLPMDRCPLQIWEWQAQFYIQLSHSIPLYSSPLIYCPLCCSHGDAFSSLPLFFSSGGGWVAISKHYRFRKELAISKWPVLSHSHSCGGGGGRPNFQESSISSCPDVVHLFPLHSTLLYSIRRYNWWAQARVYWRWIHWEEKSRPSSSSSCLHIVSYNHRRPCCLAWQRGPALHLVRW